MAPMPGTGRSADSEAPMPGTGQLPWTDARKHDFHVDAQIRRLPCSRHPRRTHGTSGETKWTAPRSDSPHVHSTARAGVVV